MSALITATAALGIRGLEGFRAFVRNYPSLSILLTGSACTLAVFVFETLRVLRENINGKPNIVALPARIEGEATYVPFRNEPVFEGPDDAMRGAIAQLHYYDSKTGDQLGVIDYGQWVGQDAHWVELTRRTTAELLLIRRTGKRWIAEGWRVTEGAHKTARSLSFERAGNMRVKVRLASNRQTTPWFSFVIDGETGATRRS